MFDDTRSLIINCIKCKTNTVVALKNLDDRLFWIKLRWILKQNLFFCLFSSIFLCVAHTVGSFVKLGLIFFFNDNVESFYLHLTFNAFHAKFGVFFKLLLLEANRKELIIPVSFETLEIFINIV